MKSRLISGTHPDEVVGLTRSFMTAGTPTVMATLWNVDDAATGQLMERFYTHLRAGASKATALRRAQLDLLAEDQYADPFYWSAFVMSGAGGEEVGLAATGGLASLPLWVWGVIGLGGVILLGGMVGVWGWRNMRNGQGLAKCPLNSYLCCVVFLV